MLLGFFPLPTSLVLVTNALQTVMHGFQMFNLIKKAGMTMETYVNKEKNESTRMQILEFALVVGNLRGCKIPSA